jgi:hypothetical protein
MLGKTYSYKSSESSAPNSDNPHRPEDISSIHHDEDSIATTHSVCKDLAISGWHHLLNIFQLPSTPM